MPKGENAKTLIDEQLREIFYKNGDYKTLRMYVINRIGRYYGIIKK